MEIVERQVPVPAEVADACAILGLDPLYVANEGRLVAMVPPMDADRVLEAMRPSPGSGAAVIGRVTDGHPGMVVARPAGATRVVDPRWRAPSGSADRPPSSDSTSEP